MVCPLDRFHILDSVGSALADYALNALTVNLFDVGPEVIGKLLDRYPDVRNPRYWTMSLKALPEYAAEQVAMLRVSEFRDSLEGTSLVLSFISDVHDVLRLIGSLEGAVGKRSEHNYYYMALQRAARDLLGRIAAVAVYNPDVLPDLEKALDFYREGQERGRS